MNALAVQPIGRRVLALCALAGALFAALLAFSPEQTLAAYTAKVKAGKLTITGDAASDKLVLRLQPGVPARLQVDVGADGTADFSFDRTTFTAIDVQAGRGDDEVSVDQSNGSFPDEALSMNGSAGADTLRGGSGAETINGGADNDVVAGGDGNDRGLLGDGDDRFEWNPGDDNDIVDGQRGVDLLDFNGSGVGEAIDVSADGGHVRFFRNIANIVTDLDGVERIGFDAFGGADTIVVNDLAGTDAKTVDIDLSAFGGGPDAQIDSVVVRATGAADTASVGSSGGRIVLGGLAAETRIAGEELIDELTLATLAGQDTIATGVGAAGSAPVNVDGGDAADVLRYSGTAGPDQIDLVANGTEASVVAPGAARIDASAVESLVVLGLAGADWISAVGNLAALTALTFDGGEDGDVLRGGNGADLLLGGNGNDDVDGNQGEDRALLGEGDDRFQWDPGDANDVVEGQGGNDRLEVFGSSAAEAIDIAANNGRVRFFRNIANITLDLDDVEALTYHALAGTDTIVVNDLAGTEAKTVDVDLAAFGGAGGDAAIDSVIAQGTAGADNASVATAGGQLVLGGLAAQTRISGDEAHDELTLATLAGADVISVAAEIFGAAPVNVDGGEEADVVRYNGTAGADTYPVVANGTEVSTTSLVPGTTRIDTSAVESLIVLGHGGADAISAVGNLAALTSLTFDGGEGDDDLRGGNGADVLIGGNGNDALDGNQGNDQVSMGAGNDRFQWDPGDGNDVVDGEGDSDLVDFFGSGASETIGVAAYGGLVRIARNIATITLDLDGIEHLAVHAMGGTDTIDVGNLAGTDLGTVDVGLGAFGGTPDGQPDTVVVNGTENPDVVQATRSGSDVVATGLAALVRIAGGEPALDTLRIQTLAGDDSVTVAADVSDVIAAVVDLGADD